MFLPQLCNGTVGRLNHKERLMLLRQGIRDDVSNSAVPDENHMIG